MGRRWVIPSDFEAARDVAAELLDGVQAKGYAGEVCFAIRLALEEALINAIKHGNRLNRTKRITVSADVADECVAVTVADEGDGFDPASVPDPTTDENIEKPSGRGIMLMRTYMDKVVYNRRGNEVRIVKHRS